MFGANDAFSGVKSLTGFSFLFLSIVLVYYKVIENAPEITAPTYLVLLLIFMIEPKAFVAPLQMSNFDKKSPYSDLS